MGWLFALKRKAVTYERKLRKVDQPLPVTSRGNQRLDTHLAIYWVRGTRTHWYGQVTKGVWGMSRRREAMKDVAGCDKPGAGVEQPLIPGSPNGATRQDWATSSCHRRLNA